ncbi:MAG TPA: hypothetical protein PLM20_03560 [Syntrophomonadaceae bacterium]|nr:hypothetical protein [Syntrophomonadaceae bacterium]HQE22965.1 hypothetical protein [Syntrophomonadaceae bacterium]
MRNFVNRIEKYLIRIIALSLAAVVLTQGFMTREPFRLYLSWGERLEGQLLEYPAVAERPDPVPPAQVESPDAVLTIVIEKYSALPKAVILVNDKERTCFENREVTLEVMAGDTIEIDSTAYDFPINYRISSVSDNLSFPEKDSVYTANHSIVMIGKVIVK